MKKIKVVFIGSGYMAGEHAKAFMDCKDFKIVGVYSKTYSNSLKFSKKYNINSVSKSIKDLYEMNKPDLVVIAVPELNLYSVLSISFKFPWVILSEKPIGYNLKNALKIDKIYSKYKPTFFVSLNRRYYSSVQNMLKNLKKNHSDRIIQVFDTQDTDLARKFNHSKKVIDNWMYANSIHNIDLINILGRGKIINVKNVITYNKLNPKLVKSIIKFDTGDIAIYTGIWNMPGPWSISVSTTSKRYDLKPLEKLFIKDRNYRCKEKEIKLSLWDINFKPGLRMQVKELSKYFSNKKNHLPDFKQALKTQKLISRIYKIQ